MRVTPTIYFSPTALRHRDKAHTHFIGSKSEVREVDRLAHDYTAGSDQVRFGAQGCPIPESMAQETSSPPEWPLLFAFLRMPGPLSLPDHRPGLMGDLCDQEVEASLRPSPCSHLPLGPWWAVSILWAQNEL